MTIFWSLESFDSAKECHGEKQEITNQKFRKQSDFESAF